jgi:hypothetical protein
LAIRQKGVFLQNEHNNHASLPRLPKHKYKEKRQKIIREAKLFVQKMWTAFIGDHSLCYKGCHSGLIQKILLMPVRGIGIRDIAEIEKSQHQKGVVM